MNEFKIKNGLIVDQDGANITGSSTITGSLTVTGSITSTQGFTGSLFGTASWSNNSTTASYALNGGVTQLLAGQNITLSPTNGLGQVTVSATLSGSTIFNTATGSYGSFYDTTTQTNPVANVPRSMSFDSTDITNGVSISGSTNPFNTYIKTQNAGVYNIQFSAQVDKTDGGTDDIVIWLRKNGIDLTDTATTITLPTNNAKVVAAWNWFVTSAANDYYQIIWLSADIDMRLLAETISATHPGIPSVILTVNRVDQFLSNTGSFSGSFTGQFTGSLLGTASYADQALTASYASTYAPVFPFTGSAIISGSLEVTGSIRALVTGSDLVNIGNASTTNQRLVRIGQDTSWVDIGSLVGSTTNSAIYFNQANPSISNSAIYGNSTGTVINSTGTITLSTNITPILTLSALGTTTLNPIASTSGATTGVTITVPSNTNQTATTNIPNFRITGANKQWATGTVPLQYFSHLTANTVSAVAASTFTNVYGLFVEAATAGTNATITNNWAIGTTGNIQVGGTGTQIVFSTATNAYLSNTAGNLRLSCGVGSRVFIDADGASVARFSSAASDITSTNIVLNGTISASGAFHINPAPTINVARSIFTLTQPADLGVGSGVETPMVLWTSGTRSWGNGNITTQRNFYVTAPTITFNTPSWTVTNAYNAYFEAPIAGTNATITNNYALGTNGNVIFDDGTSKMIWRAVPTIPSYSGIFLNVNPSSTNFTLANDGSGNTFLNGFSSVYIAANATNVARFGATFQLYTPVAASSGALIKWQLTVPADTNQTTTTNIPNFLITGANKQWATGNITNQYWNYLTANTASFVGASTMTNSYGLFVEAATAGTNATITNNYAAGFSGSVYISRGLVLGTTSSAFIGSGQVYASNGFLSVANSSLGGIIGYTNNLGLYSKFSNGAVSIGHNGGTTTVMNIYSSSMNYTGSAFFTGSLTVTGSVNASSFTGSLEGTASYAVTASYALNGGGGAAFPYTGSAEITGSLAITGSLSVSEGVGIILDTTAGVLHNPSSGLISLDWTNAQLYKSDGTTVAIDWENGAFTGSLEGTASYASTASYVNGSIIKSNALPPGIFGGTPLTATVTFTTDFPNPSYSVTITGEDARIFTIQNKSATGFEINTNSNVALTGTTYWHAINYGEFNS